MLEEEKVAEAEEKATLRDELETLKKEQDDLLVLLADQDAKIGKLKDKLKELGQEVSSINWWQLTSASWVVIILICFESAMSMWF